MRSIPLLDVNATEIFDEIAAAKRQPRRGRMQAARAEVLAAYQGYDDIAPEFSDLVRASLTDLQKDAMRHAFNVETEPMTALRGDLLKRVCVARCPLCGISESSTLDHYLPKEQYPEYSVFPSNLVPSCAVCNTRKRDRVLDEGTSVRMFLHPCYDPIPNLAFLTVRIRMEADALILSYQLTRPDGMALRNFQHLRSHFKELNLADRYRRMGLEHLGGQYPALRRAYGLGNAERVAEKLNEEAQDFEEVFGPNYWLAKLYRALASNIDFCDGGFEAVRAQVQP
ncbi:HNH endonuclease [Pseudomonas aeruginosa]|uniref:HNH endonuclease n=1 Tax=Pseudomonas TaxID=286 RepID=UPI00053E0541|nr:HNH endonuclease signature motif containing protein [Pseudomonas aeruginosa]HBP6267119.1 HNH endonuclease [Pseudomonas aeruginosa]HEJ1152738.1 HNH endonuclease [Pseudomonas aeruginosa]